jgi:hypothetical protein
MKIMQFETASRRPTLRPNSACVAFLSFFAVCHDCAAAQAPAILRGKSIVVHWDEARQQKTTTETTIRSFVAYGTYQIYLAETGKTYGRLRFEVPNRKGKVKSGTNDKVSGETSGREPRFNGNLMNVTWSRGQGGATTIDVKFDSDLLSCTAHVVTGKSPGAASIRARSIVDDSTAEIYSAVASGETCSVQNGNVFAQ